MPLVSVIIPCFNQGKYLQETVDSVLASIYENIEIIIVDDGSFQDVEFLQKFSAPKTKVLHQENQGVAVARNNGIQISGGKYILPLDSDDKIAPTYIEKAVKILERDEKISIVYSEAEFFGTKKGKWEIEEYKFPDILWTNSIFCSAVYKKSDWQKVGGYKNEMDLGFEDWEFWLSLIEAGANVYKIPEVLFFYRQHKNTRSEVLTKTGGEIQMIKKLVKLHPALYADNLESVLLPLHQKIEYYLLDKTLISKLRYKINNILRKVL